MQVGNKQNEISQQEIPRFMKQVVMLLSNQELRKMRKLLLRNYHEIAV